MLMMATILRRERCPRCRGNVVLKRDTYGRYWSCVQCGATWDIEEQRGQPAPPAGEEGKCQSRMATAIPRGAAGPAA